MNEGSVLHLPHELIFWAGCGFIGRLFSPTSLKIIASVRNWESVEISVCRLVVGRLYGLLLCLLSVCTLEHLIHFCIEGTLEHSVAFGTCLIFYSIDSICCCIYVCMYVCMKSMEFCIWLVEFVLAFLRFSNGVRCDLVWGGVSGCVRSLERQKLKDAHT